MRVVFFIYRLRKQLSSLQSAICVTIEFPLILGEAIFVGKSQKSTNSIKFLTLEIKAPYGSSSPYRTQCNINCNR